MNTKSSPDLHQLTSAVWIITIISAVRSLSNPLEGTIIEVQPQCAEDTSGVTKVVIVADAPVFYGYARCFNNHLYNFSEVDLAHQSLDVHFSGNETHNCMFNKKRFARTYTLEVFVVVGTGSGVLTDEQFYLITCTYDPYDKDKSEVKDFGTGLSPPQDVTINLGTAAQSIINLTMVDVLGDEITNSITVGDKVKLKAEMVYTAPGEISFHPLACKATTPDTEYSIIVAGCGDGRVLPEGSGFITVNETAYSPVFQAFRIDGSLTLTFTCTYYICEEPCDGTSCLVIGKRHKRDLSALDELGPESGIQKLKAASVVKHLFSTSVEYFIKDREIERVIVEEKITPQVQENVIEAPTENHVSAHINRKAADAKPLRMLGEEPEEEFEDHETGMFIALCVISVVAISSIFGVMYLLYKNQNHSRSEAAVVGSSISVTPYSDPLEYENYDHRRGGQ